METFLKFEWFFKYDWVVIITLGGMIFITCYLMADRAINFLHKQSLGQREEVMRYLQMMFVTTNERQVTLAMLSASFAPAAIIFILCWPHVWVGTLFGGFILVGMWSLPKIFIKSMWEKRCSLFVDQMVDGMTLMANGMTAGLSAQTCMERVRDNLPNPISQEFGQVIEQMKIGSSMNEALNELGTRIPKPDVQMFVTSVNILNETGGNMAETFQTITYTVRERQKVEKKIEALTAQGITQGVIISLVPLFLLLVFWVVDPNYVKPLFTTALGLVAIFVMLSLQVIGGLMIRKIVRINV